MAGLEILDGDSAGDTFDLGSASISIGRRQGNTIVLDDEKVSGRHAEVVAEDDHFLLKDLDSTNGTFLDGRQIGEVVLTANDIVRVGRVRVAFKEKGAPTPGGEDMRVRKIDAATLAKTGKRGAGIGMLLIVVVGLLAAGAWWMRSGISKGGGVANAKQVLRVSANLLPRGVDSVEGIAAEDDDEPEAGWITDASGLQFDISRRAHTGTSALRAVYTIPEPGDGGAQGAPRHHALARTAKALNIVGGQSLELRGFLWTKGNAKAALRLRFTSSVPEEHLSITVGTKPAEYDGYTPVKVELAVPPDLDRVQVEVLALLPNESSEVLADDFALLNRGGAKPEELRTGNGFRLVGSGAGVAVRSPTAGIVMTAVVPVVNDPALVGLDSDGLLFLADAGAELKLTGSAKGFGGAGP